MGENGLGVDLIQPASRVILNTLMSDNSSRHSDSKERPFLASDEVHQAQPMGGAKKSASEQSDAPAPILPTANQAPSENTPEPTTTDIDFLPKNSGTELTESSDEDGGLGSETTKSAKDSSSAQLPESATLPNSPSLVTPDSDTTEKVSTELTPAVESRPAVGPVPISEMSSEEPEIKLSYPSSGKALAVLTAAVVALAGLSAVWYNFNQDIYTLTTPDSRLAANPTPEPTRPSTLAAEAAKGTVTLTLQNLPALDKGLYHLWLQEGDETHSLGEFEVNNNQAVSKDGKLFQPDIDVSGSDASLLVSIEAKEGASEPSATIILEGAIQNNRAQLGFTAIDLHSAKGVYTIAAPSDLSGNDQTSGIWLATTDGKSLTGAGLDVPTAPDGWSYELQVSYKDEIVVAGRFKNPNGKDSLTLFTPNPDHIPDYPGEDYLLGAPSRLGLDFPTDLTTGEWKLIVSLEPDHNGTDPTGDKIFFLQPFTATIAKGSESYKEYSLKVDTSHFPTATAELH